MFKKMFFLTAVLAGALLVLSGIVLADEDAALELFKKKCNICHSSSYATDMTDTEEGWRDTVTRMIEDNGAVLSEAEYETIVKYLTQNYGHKK